MPRYKVYAELLRDTFIVEAEDKDDAIDTARAEMEMYYGGGIDWEAYETDEETEE